MVDEMLHLMDWSNGLPTLSHLPDLKNLAVGASTKEYIGYGDSLPVGSPIPTIASLVGTSPSLKRLNLRINMASWNINVTAKPDIWSPLVSLAEHPLLENIELRIVPVVLKKRDTTNIDIISALMEVHELKKMCEKSFLSMKKKSQSGLGLGSVQDFFLVRRIFS